MSMLDFFNGDSFNVVSLSAALDLYPYQPNWLGNLGLFQRKGISTTTALVESREGILSLVPTSARGTVTETKNRPNRKMRSFIVPHLALTAGILAEDVQSVRAFAQENVVETLAQKVMDVASSLRGDIDITKEFWRHKALEGIVLDEPSGATQYNYFTEFGTAEQTEDFKFSVATTDIKAACTSVIRKMHDALGGTMFQGIVGLAGDEWFDALVGHAKVLTAFQRIQDGLHLSVQQIGGAGYFAGPDGQAGFTFGGITFFNSRAKIGSTPFIPTDVCRFFPVGVPNLFLEINAPADYIETVNTEGMEYYVKQEQMKFDKGIDMEVQSNPLIMPTRPRALIKGTKS